MIYDIIKYLDLDRLRKKSSQLLKITSEVEINQAKP